MLVYQKQPDGSWKRSGEILPTETQVTVAINAESHGPTVYSPAEAIRFVESLIAGDYLFIWRFEIAGASAKAKRKGK